MLLQWYGLAIQKQPSLYVRLEQMKKNNNEKQVFLTVKKRTTNL